ncbi:MHYT domain-containing protein, NO-binding membrane sensor [Rhodococcus rhodochrous J3]|uniref:MHYT domain-containing protein, NO-binding membrane sensor n=1 Tax=Rhodococcus rhodochrous J3 TaxID=903528 RepID=A0ABY1M8C6_RHORH|nr:MHYT domain-containing protein [Rhodococcus rhodochrous]MBF4480531.1 signal protein [Rhodococcus rhodochrous]TWH42032.1 NO-binding membrane sensor protein with MHYT domain [Rhodococcus rhodochrous J38]SMG26763.1 MHYT domain-containing protein, NO-binding membrane sensor [Rhodococcus rhodochrous J3]
MSHEVHHFSMGGWLFALAYITSAVGCYAGLSCARKAANAWTSVARTRWTLMAALSIGGVGIWLMHFIGMMGFDVPGSTIRYDLGLTLLSVALAVAATLFGLRILDTGAQWIRALPSDIRLLVGGVIMGFAVAGMHYSGMAAVRIQGELEQGRSYVTASVAIGVVASIVALWLSRVAERPAVRIPAAAVMGCAVVALHYTGMAGIAVTVDPSAPHPEGMTIMTLLFPGFIIGVTLLAVPVVALMASASTQDLEQEREVATWFGGGGAETASRPHGRHVKR